MKFNRPTTIALASVLVMSAAIPASVSAQQYRRAPTPAPAQTYDQWLDQQDDYRRDQQEYEAARRAWEEKDRAYQQRQASYQQRRQDYEMRRAQWERDRADYDRRNGYGSYVRRYGEWRYEPDGRYVDNRYDDRGGRDYYADWRDERCERRETRSQVVGGLIGALAGAAIGNNVASTNSQTEGTVLGALVGGVAGAKIGEKVADCDEDGYYYTYAQTYEYREPRYTSGRSGRYDRSWYINNRCRLAIAPTEYGGRSDYRYVRVCPDRRGRYRITG